MMGQKKARKPSIEATKFCIPQKIVEKSNMIILQHLKNSERLLIGEIVIIK